MVDFYFYLFFTFAYLLLLVMAILKKRNQHVIGLTSFLYLVLAGLIYDNAIIAFGKYIGTSSLLEHLHLLRYWIHAIITPTLILFCLGVLQKSGKKKYHTTTALLLTFTSTCVLVLIELVTVVAGIELKPVSEYGILHYIPIKESGGSLMIVTVSVILLITGFLLYRYTRWKWMLVGAIIMGIGSALPIELESTAFTNAMELLLISSLVATEITFSSKTKENSLFTSSE